MAGKFSLLPSGKVFLQILSCGIEDTAPSLFLFTDSKRYLFNCGEGTQRLLTEHKIRISKLSTIFISQNKWSHIGGFLGMSMTLRDIGRDTIGLYGPPGLNRIVHGARFFLNKENVDFKVAECSADHIQTYQDDEITIKPVIVFPDINVGKKADSCSKYSYDGAENDSNASLAKKHYRKQVICYVAKLRDFPGKLLPQVAASLGVPKGPMFRQLKDGQSVTLPNGKVVTPEQVTEPAIPGPSFLVIDCPTKKYISSITGNQCFKEYQTDGDNKATLVVHMADKDIIADSSYQSWISRFDKDTYHCMLDQREISKCPPVYSTQYAMQCMLNKVHPTVFPLIEKWRNNFTSNKSSNIEETGDSLQRFNGTNLAKFNLRPKSILGYDASEELKFIDVDMTMKESFDKLIEFDEKNILKIEADYTSLEADDIGNLSVSIKDRTTRKRHVEVMKEEGLAEPCKHKICKCSSETESLIDNLQSEDKCDCPDAVELERDAKWPSRYPRVVFLGTGSSIPSKYRNVTAILLHISATATALLDCGEGTYGQIVNHYGDEADEMIKRLKFVFISHLHADHHLGLIRILKLRQKLLKKTGSSYVPPLVAAPRNLSIWLKEYSSACESVQFRFADCKGLVSNNSKHSLLQDISEIFKVIITPVDHHTEAYGIALCHNDGWKITYSGDTEPCQSLVDAGKDSTLLIHEATFEDGLEEDAKEKHHSTCGQALEIAEQMKAKNVLLTHFSQRYSKLPVMKNETPVAVAFDHMEVHPDDIPEISKLLPKLQVLFQEDDKMK